jgi:tetratricopeptide (TPR) repeat protein
MAITHLRVRWCLWLGRIRSKREDYGGALICYERVLRFFPKHLRALANAGNCLEHQGFYAEAINFYDRALQERPDYPDVHARLGVIFSRLQRYQESIDSLNRAFRMKPRSLSE